MAVTTKATTGSEPSGPGSDMSDRGLLTRIMMMLVTGAHMLNPNSNARVGTEHAKLLAAHQSAGAGMIVGMGIAIGAGGIVLNEMAGLDIVNNSSGVVDVSSIFSTAGNALVLLSIAMIVGAAAVIMGFFGNGGRF
jgi:hypothetical protein